MPQPSDMLTKALNNRRKLADALDKFLSQYSSLVGSKRRHADQSAEGIEKQQRKNASMVKHLLEEEGFPDDYDLPVPKPEVEGAINESSSRRC